MTHIVRSVNFVNFRQLLYYKGVKNDYLNILNNKFKKLVYEIEESWLILKINYL